MQSNLNLLDLFNLIYSYLQVKENGMNLQKIFKEFFSNAPRNPQNDFTCNASRCRKILRYKRQTPIKNVVELLTDSKLAVVLGPALNSFFPES